MKLKIPLLAAVVLMPLLAVAAPTVKITSPKPNTSSTNGVITSAAGTAVPGKNKAAIAAVYYSLDSGASWASAIGTTNWSIPVVAFAAGPNNFWVYAADTNNAVSATNKVVYTYVVMWPLTVMISPSNSWGKANPNDNDTPLQIGKTYKMTATAAKGFKFNGWTGSTSTLSATLSFQMKSNLAFTANFIDNTRPLCVITSPKASQKFTNTPSITASCRASDNVGVASVWYQLNGGNWDSDAATTDGTNYSIDDLIIASGSNTLATYSVDAAGNKSLTNTIKFTSITNTPPPSTNQLVPASLAGMTGLMTETDYPTTPESLSFGVSTYALISTNLNVLSKAGNYSYTVVSSNTALLASTTIFPQAQSGSEKTIVLVFASSNACFVTNEDGIYAGYLTLAPAANVVPSSSSIALVSTFGAPNTMSMGFGRGLFTNYFDTGASPANWGTCNLQHLSPVAALMVESFTDANDTGNTSYLFLNFSDVNDGTWVDWNINLDGENTYSGTGKFQVMSLTNPPAGIAPTNLSGITVSGTSNGHSFTNTFGDYTYSGFDSNTNDENCTVGDYCFIKTGPNTGKFIHMDVLPPEWADDHFRTTYLTFTSSSSVTYSNEDGSTGTVNYSMAGNFAPTSLAGRSVTNYMGNTAVSYNRFNNDGTMTWTPVGGESQTWPYAYEQFSSVGGMIIMGPRDDNSVTYVQLQFGSNTAGSAFETDFDPLGIVTDLITTTFKGFK